MKLNCCRNCWAAFSACSNSSWVDRLAASNRLEHGPCGQGKLGYFLPPPDKKPGVTFDPEQYVSRGLPERHLGHLSHPRLGVTLAETVSLRLRVIAVAG